MDVPPSAVMVAFMFAIVVGVIRPVFLSWEGRPSRAAVSTWERAVRAETDGPTAWDSLDAQVARAARVGTGPGDTAAMRAVLASRERAGAPLSTVWDAFGLLPGPLPDSIRQLLRMMGSGPSLEALERLARGGPVALGLVVAPGALDRDSAWILGQRLRTTSVLAVRQAARVALDLAEGRRQESEARARTILAFGWQLWRAPIPVAHPRALGILDLGVRTLREIGTVAGDRTLLRETDRLADVIASRREQTSQIDPRRFETYVSAPYDTLLLRLIADRRLAPVDRWRLIEAVADGACWRPREVHAGVAPARRAALEEALRLASDIPQTADWVAVQRQVLAYVDAGRHPVIQPPFRLVPPLARSLVCGGVRGGSFSR